MRSITSGMVLRKRPLVSQSTQVGYLAKAIVRPGTGPKNVPDQIVKVWMKLEKRLWTENLFLFRWGAVV